MLRRTIALLLGVFVMPWTWSSGAQATRYRQSVPLEWWSATPQNWIPAGHIEAARLRGEAASNLRKFVPAGLYKAHSGCLAFNRRYAFRSYIMELLNQPGEVYKVGRNEYVLWGNQMNDARCNAAIVMSSDGAIQAVSINEDGVGSSRAAVATIYWNNRTTHDEISLLALWAGVRQTWIKEYVPSWYRSAANYFIVKTCHLADAGVKSERIGVGSLRCNERKQPIRL